MADKYPGKLNVNFNSKKPRKTDIEIGHESNIDNFEMDILYATDEQLQDYIKSLKEEVQRRIKPEQ